nr:hypothetical protein [Tanacetum cinerariifolium]
MANMEEEHDGDEKMMTILLIENKIDKTDKDEENEEEEEAGKFFKSLRARTGSTRQLMYDYLCIESKRRKVHDVVKNIISWDIINDIDCNKDMEYAIGVLEKEIRNEKRRGEFGMVDVIEHNEDDEENKRHKEKE